MVFLLICGVGLIFLGYIALVMLFGEYLLDECDTPFPLFLLVTVFFLMVVPVATIAQLKSL